MKKPIYSVILVVVALYMIAIFLPVIIMYNFQKQAISLLLAPFALAAALSIFYLLFSRLRKAILLKQAAEKIDMFINDDEYSVRIG